MPTAPSHALSTTPFSPRHFPQAVIEPEIAWKKNLYQTIEGSFQSLVDDVKRVYDERLTAAGTEEERGLAGEEYHKRMNNIRNLAKESFQARLDCERQERMLALGRNKQAEQEETTARVETTSPDTTAATTTDGSSTPNPTSALDSAAELPAGPSSPSQNIPMTIPAASLPINVEHQNGQLSRGSEARNFDLPRPLPVPIPLTTASTPNTALITGSARDVPPELAAQGDEDTAIGGHFQTPIASNLSPEPGQSRHPLASADDEQVQTSPKDKLQGLQQVKLPSAGPMQPSPSRHERWLPSAEEIIAYTPGSLLRPAAPLHEKWQPSTEKKAVSPPSGAPSQPSPSSHERWLPSTETGDACPIPAAPSPPSALRHERWLRSAQTIVSSISRAPSHNARPISDIASTSMAAVDFSPELSARRTQYSSLYQGGHPRPPIPSLSSLKIEESQIPSASASDRVPTDSKDSSPFDGDINGWRKMLRKVENISQQWEVVRTPEARRQDTAGRKVEVWRSEELNTRKREQEDGNKDEGLPRRTQELKQRQGEASRKELEPIRKEQETQQKGEELKRREEELCDEKRHSEEPREGERNEEEELCDQAGQLEAKRMTASSREELRKGEEELQRCEAEITTRPSHQGAEPCQREERCLEKGDAGMGRPCREQQEPEQQLSAEDDGRVGKAGAGDPERRSIKEIWRQKQTGQTERGLGEEHEGIYQQTEEGKLQRAYANAYDPASSNAPSWTLAQADAWGSSPSSFSARTSIASYSTIFEQTDDGITGWQRRLEEMYQAQQEQFRREQERLEPLDQAHGVSRGQPGSSLGGP